MLGGLLIGFIEGMWSAYFSIDYKDVDLRKKFITERGKILPRRLTGLTAKQQRDLTNAVKRARIVALLPFVNPEG